MAWVALEKALVRPLKASRVRRVVKAENRMAMPIGDILDVLRERGIEPDEEPEAVDLPGIGQVEEGETIYSTSVAEVFSRNPVLKRGP